MTIMRKLKVKAKQPQRKARTMNDEFEGPNYPWLKGIENWLKLVEQQCGRQAVVGILECAYEMHRRGITGKKTRKEVDG